MLCSVHPVLCNDWSFVFLMAVSDRLQQDAVELRLWVANYIRPKYLYLQV
ncbi:hypothetical protein [Nostoc sp. FACHB-857]|nr:hypothetical protein [Nostoc sp. FACHB-857]